MYYLTKFYIKNIKKIYKRWYDSPTKLDSELWLLAYRPFAVRRDIVWQFYVSEILGCIEEASIEYAETEATRMIIVDCWNAAVEHLGLREERKLILD